MTIRRAKIDDAREIQGLVNYYAKKELMLPRPLNEIYENLRDFFVCEEDQKIVGCAALHVSWEDLAEVKSLAVLESHQRRGIGIKLLEEALEEARRLNIRRVFTLTYVPDFFRKRGFRQIEKAELPHKVWGECVHCVKFPDCDEIPLLIELKDT